ncbi:MAG: Ku protein [Chloroflexi bacterium]|nr:Ku protein [Chloroflexota bacterium]
MPQRAIWKGAISFGMVAIPIKLYIATESKDVSFVTLHRACHSRLRQRRYCPQCEADVEAAETVRGYEYSKDQFVPMEEADFEGLPVPSLHTIEITQFVELSSIDPIYFERTYMLEPDGVGLKPYYLLKQALHDTGRVAIAKVSLRQKEHLCCLRPFGPGLAMETMYYADEVRGTKELNLPEDQVKVSAPELKMANTLIDQLTGPLEIESYHDEYRATLTQVIEAKLGAAQPIAASPAPPTGKVRDLMEALKASIEAAKKERAAAIAAPPESAAAEAPRLKRRKAS